MPRKYLPKYIWDFIQLPNEEKVKHKYRHQYYFKVRECAREAVEYIAYLAATLPEDQFVSVFSEDGPFLISAMLESYEPKGRRRRPQQFLWDSLYYYFLPRFIDKEGFPLEFDISEPKFDKDRCTQCLYFDDSREKCSKKNRRSRKYPRICADYKNKVYSEAEDRDLLWYSAKLKGQIETLREDCKFRKKLIDMTTNSEIAEKKRDLKQVEKRLSRTEKFKAALQENFTD